MFHPFHGHTKTKRNDRGWWNMKCKRKGQRPDRRSPWNGPLRGGRCATSSPFLLCGVHLQLVMEWAKKWMRQQSLIVRPFSQVERLRAVPTQSRPSHKDWIKNGRLRLRRNKRKRESMVWMLAINLFSLCGQHSGATRPSIPSLFSFFFQAQLHKISSCWACKGKKK